jgi:hypothetical protein
MAVSTGLFALFGLGAVAALAFKKSEPPTPGAQMQAAVTLPPLPEIPLPKPSSTPAPVDPKLAMVYKADTLPAPLQSQVAKVIEGLGLQPDGTFSPIPNPAQIEATFLVCDQLESLGYPECATSLKTWAKLAQAQVPVPTSVVQASTSPAIPPALAAKVQTAIAAGGATIPELLALIDELEALPGSTPEVEMLIQILEAKVAQLQEMQITLSAASATETVITTPGVASTNSTTVQAPTWTPSTTAAIPTAIVPPLPPLPPAPATPPAVASPLLAPAQAMVANLIAVQAIGFPQCKGKEDVGMVKAFQSAAGLTADGKAGPGVLIAAAQAGVCQLPRVMYWPVGSTSSAVYNFRSTVNNLAQTRPNPCRDQLLNSAAAERGQAGIVGPMPPAGPTASSTVDIPSAIATAASTIPIEFEAPISPVTGPSSPAAIASKSALLVAAESAMSALATAQTAHGFPNCKGKENFAAIKAFQAAAGLSADGKAGPGTLIAAAQAGVCQLPRVMYWPVGATASNVTQYRSSLTSIAAGKSDPCKGQLQASAAAERGQAGIVGPQPT